MFHAKEKAQKLKQQKEADKEARNKRIDDLLDAIVSQQSNSAVQPQSVMANALLSMGDPLLLLQLAMRNNPGLGSLNHLHQYQQSRVPPLIPAFPPYHQPLVYPSAAPPAVPQVNVPAFQPPPQLVPNQGITGFAVNAPNLAAQVPAAQAPSSQSTASASTLDLSSLPRFNF
jgi:hypothetical protein